MSNGLRYALQLAKVWTARHFSQFAVVAWTGPLDETFTAWTEEAWLALSLNYRTRLRPQSVWKNGHTVTDVDLFTLTNLPTKKKGRRSVPRRD